MKYRFGTITIDETGQKTNFLNELSEQEFNILEANILKVHAYKTNRNLYNMFLYNFIELSDFFQVSANNLVREHESFLQDNSKQLSAVYIHSNRLFLNFLSSFRMLTDHTGTYLSRTYGNESVEHTSFIKKTHECYDNHFEYRFMCRLRNYAQHCGLPISKITFERKREDQTEHMSTGTLNAFFERDVLLKSYDRWGKDVKPDLESQEEAFPAMWTVGNFYHTVEPLVKHAEQIEQPHILNAISVIEDICKNVPKNVGETVVCYDFELSSSNSYENSNFKTLTVPWDIINEFSKADTTI